MINSIKFQNFKSFKTLGLVLLALYPLAIISGNLLINFFTILISISFFLNLKDNKKYFSDKSFYLLIFFFISLLINNIVSIDPQNSFPRTIKILFIIFFVIEIKRLVNIYKTNYLKYVFLSWSLILLFLSLDIIFETIFGHNIIGIKSYMPGRVASFFGDELVAGAFFHGFILFFFSYLINVNIKDNKLLFIIIAILVISFLIGERSNFIKVFLSILIFSSLAIKIDYKLKTLSTLIILVLIAIFINFNDFYKSRYYNQIKTIFSINGYQEYIKKSQYGAHRDASIKIFNEYFLFGVGLKNYRLEVGKKKYENNDFLKTEFRVATHPHQIHHELLSETGIFGYLCFLIFLVLSLYYGIKSYLINKNLYLLSSIIFILTSVLPILPSGSFFSTYTGGIFWLNYAIMLGFTNTKS
jgi:hypothetical protein